MPRFMLAAAHKSSGKTVVSTGIAAALAARGQGPQCFKKGPDYIDPMWLAAASGRACYNLDFNTMDGDEIGRFFESRAGALNLIEANKGLFDGVATDGSDSNAAMAKLLDAPVVLVIDTNGMTRGIAPLLMGYLAFDPDVQIAGVILNKTGGARHEAKLRAAVETYTDLKVLGAVPRHGDLDIGERHLGLITPSETPDVRRFIDRAGEIVGGSVDLDALVALAGTASSRPSGALPPVPWPDLRIAIARDAAFGFYYPDDLEVFAAAGAELVAFDALRDAALPDCDGLFIGGGFPETQAAALAGNAALRADIRAKIEAGLPTYAECGGLMYLCRSLVWQGESHAMVGVVPGDAVMYPRPEGRGYARFRVTGDNPWEMANAEVRAHEFHYARVENLPPEVRFGREITRGAGIGGGHDGVVMHNLMAGFVHLRSSAANPWVARFVDFVRSLK
jgi:cobyrinic acid a,c-diamide synthase